MTITPLNDGLDALREKFMEDHEERRAIFMESHDERWREFIESEEVKELWQAFEGDEWEAFETNDWEEFLRGNS